MSVNEVRFDKENNRVVIPVFPIDPNTGHIYVSPQTIRKILPMADMKPQQKIEELQMIIHEIHKDRLVHIRDYIKELHRLSNGEEKARQELETCPMKEVKRWSEIAKTWMNQKNILREIRYAIKLLATEEEYVRELIAKVEAGLL